MEKARKVEVSSEEKSLAEIAKLLREYPTALSYNDFETCTDMLTGAIRIAEEYTQRKTEHADNRNSMRVLRRKVQLHYKRARIYFRSGELKLAFDDCRAIRTLRLAQSAELSTSAYVVSALQLEALILIILGNDRRARQTLEDALAFVKKHANGDLEEAVRTMMPRSTILLMIPNLSAMKWHSLRREFILDFHPEVAQLYENSKTPPSSSFWSRHVGLLLAALLMFLTLVQFTVAVMVGLYANTLAMLLCASSVGAICAYGIQALNHDLCHVRRHRWLNAGCMIISSSLCNFPWALYYRVYHQRHHAYTGTEYDRDGDILFQPWHSPPRVNLELQLPRLWRSRLSLIRWFQYFEEQEIGAQLPASKLQEAQVTIDFAQSPLWRFVWTILFSWGIYVVFHIRKYQFDSLHIPQLKYEGLWLLASLVLFRFGGLYAIMYVWWSSAFSLGACGHPYLGFWLIQHASRRRPIDETTLTTYAKLSTDPAWAIRRLKSEALQPTVSSRSLVANLFNFGELQHVEHHDFPMIPAIRYPYLNAKAAAEFYENLASCPSVITAIYDWIVADDGKWMMENGDFAARERYLTDSREDQRDSALFYHDKRY